MTKSQVTRYADLHSKSIQWFIHSYIGYIWSIHWLYLTTGLITGVNSDNNKLKQDTC